MKRRACVADGRCRWLRYSLKQGGCSETPEMGEVGVREDGKVYLLSPGGGGSVYDDLESPEPENVLERYEVLKRYWSFTTARPPASSCASSPGTSSCQVWFQSAALPTRHLDRRPSWYSSSCSYKRPLVRSSVPRSNAS